MFLRKYSFNELSDAEGKEGSELDFIEEGEGAGGAGLRVPSCCSGVCPMTLSARIKKLPICIILVMGSAAR